MSEEQNTNNGIGEISRKEEIVGLRHSPSIATEDLFGSRKMGDSKRPARTGYRIATDTPMETAIGRNNDIIQDLVAVLALGEHVAVGVVKGTNLSGAEAHYLSLIGDPFGSEGRAKIIDVLSDGEPITIGRSQIEKVAGHEGACPGVSATHCTIELKDGVLTVIDEDSLNGTSVFSNNTTSGQKRFFRTVYTWSQPSSETSKLIEAEAEKQTQSLHLGRFTVENN